MSYLLTFFMDLRESSQLLEGRLVLTHNGELRHVFRATSGTPGNQDREDVRLRGKGAIPDTIRSGVPNYFVLTNAIPMQGKTGINGNFYKINPHSINVEGIQRGDFGIHADANVPGSAGCIVLPPGGNGWQVFQREMADLKAKSIASIPLVVVYC